jgi:hypothetical protein
MQVGERRHGSDGVIARVALGGQRMRDDAVRLARNLEVTGCRRGFVRCCVEQRAGRR